MTVCFAGVNQWKCNSGKSAASRNAKPRSRRCAVRLSNRPSIISPTAACASLIVDLKATFLLCPDPHFPLLAANNQTD